MHVYVLVTAAVNCVIIEYLYVFSTNQPLLPSPCTESDAELLLRHLSSSQPDLQLFGSVAATKSFLRICCDHFKPAILEKAQAVSS